MRAFQEACEVGRAGGPADGVEALAGAAEDAWEGVGDCDDARAALIAAAMSL